jgi:methionyl-tRNA synthetase
LDDPDAQGKVLYVWFDAPIGYISFTAELLQQRGGDEQAYRQWWCDPDTPIIHFIGEDNTVFHALIWPAMLMAEGEHQLPRFVVANNFVNLGLEKISKSQTPQASPVWIEEYLKRFDPDALRYYLTAIAPESARTNFELSDFLTRNNSELVAALGNFVNRTVSLAKGVVPDASAVTEADRALLTAADAALQRVGACIESHRFRAGLEELMAFARDCNQHIGNRAPWTARKTNPADADASIATCLHACRFLAVMMWPYMPRAAQRLRAMLLDTDGPVCWAAPAPPPTGVALPPPEILFQKLEPNCMEEVVA